MLPAALSSGDLRRLAGHAYARGQEYWREGRVTSCVSDDRSIEGVVIGTAAYRVRVSAHAGQLVSACTCPVGGGMCKHAVALVLHHLDQRPAPARDPAPITGAFATRAELLAFAEAHGLKHALAVSAEELGRGLELAPQDFWVRTVLARLTIGDVGALDLAARHARARNVDVALAQAAYRVLQEAAAVVRDGQREEAARPAAIDDPITAPLWAKLVEVRGAVRARAMPRSRAARATAGAWELDAGAFAIVWRERARVSRPRDFGTFPVAARLGFPGGTGVQLECTCGIPAAHCTHALALIDSVLDLLADPARADEAHALAQRLLRPAWARALDELARLDARTDPARAPIELWWELDPDSERGEPTVGPLVRRRTKKGLSAGSRPTVTALLAEHRDALSEVDLGIAGALAAAASMRLGGPAPAAVVYALAGHPRVRFAGHEEPIAVVRTKLGFNAVAAGADVRIEPAVEGARVSPALLDALLALHPPGTPLVLAEPEHARCVLVDADADARRLWAVLARHGDAFPPESHAQLIECLARLETRLPVAVPRELKGARLDATPVTVARLRLLPDVTLELEVFVRPGPGAPLFAPGTGPRDVLIARDGQRGYIRRDLDAELPRVRAHLAALPMTTAHEGPPLCFQLGDPDEALALVAALQEPPAGVEAEWLDEPPVVRGTVRAEMLRVRIDKRHDWFGIVGDAKHEGGRIELAVLLDAARRQQRFVRVDARRWVELGATLRERLLAVADGTYATRERLELSPGAAPAIQALAEAGVRVETADAWDQLAKRLATGRALRPKPPAALRAKLRDYQVEGHAWLSRVAAWGAGACLADDMGLGKTVQAIAVLIDRAKRGPAFVLAPTSVTHNWVDELARFAPSLRPILYTELGDRAGTLAALRKGDVLIASYGLLVRDAAQLAAVPFATLVADEAQALKNPATQRAKAARHLTAEFRIALTGTPLENHLGDLWSLFALVFPGLLGSWEQFRDRYAVPIEKHRSPAAREALSRVIRPFLLRRTKQEVARELPARTEITVPVVLSDAEQAMYEDARLAAIAELSRRGDGVRAEQRRFQVLAALTRLRLLASHPKLYDPSSRLGSSKLARALELLEEMRAEGHRALVFSQFTSHLALVRAALDEAGFTSLYLDGATPAAQRAKLIEEFQSGAADVFVISLKAGGQGINLTAADYVLHLDPWWNPAVEDQATDRAHRIGQTRPVTVYRLIARGTIEERIVGLHADKRALVAEVLDGAGVAARLTTKDLLALLQGPEPAPDRATRDRDERR